MNSRTILIVSLLFLVVPVMSAGPSDALSTAKPTREGTAEQAEDDAVVKPKATALDKTTTDAAAKSEAASTPSLDASIAPESSSGGVTTWEEALTPAEADHGRTGRGGRSGHGGWRPPSTPPHGRRGQWRRDRYHHYGSWRFLVFCGPRVWWPRPSAHVVRLPRHNGIYVTQTGDDALGRALATSVRDRLRAHGLKVVYSSDDAAIELFMVSMDGDPTDPGWNSAVSVSYIANPGNRFVTSQLLDLGDEQVDELAEYVADYVDELADDYCR